MGAVTHLAAPRRWARSAACCPSQQGEISGFEIQIVARRWISSRRACPWRTALDQRTIAKAARRGDVRLLNQLSTLHAHRISAARPGAEVVTGLLEVLRKDGEPKTPHAATYAPPNAGTALLIIPATKFSSAWRSSRSRASEPAANRPVLEIAA
jgi:hypothetical protein